MRIRALAVSSAALITVGLAGTAAVAEVPTNDNIENATVISALPYTVTENIKDATELKSDPKPKCDRGVASNVWWTITPSTSGWLVADTKGSAIKTVAAVFTGSPGNLTQVACNDDTERDGNYSQKARVFWDAKAGTQYYLLIAKDFGHGGDLTLTVNNSAPPFSVDSISIDGGSVDNSTGKAVINGTMSCTSGPGEVYLEVRVQQQWARLYITGERSGRIECEGVTTWHMKVGSRDGTFSGGQADVSARARWEDGNGGRISVPASTITLHG